MDIQGKVRKCSVAHHLSASKQTSVLTTGIAHQSSGHPVQSGSGVETRGSLDRGAGGGSTTQSA